MRILYYIHNLFVNLKLFQNKMIHIRGIKRKGFKEKVASKLRCEGCLEAPKGLDNVKIIPGNGTACAKVQEGHRHGLLVQDLKIMQTGWGHASKDPDLAGTLWP